MPVDIQMPPDSEGSVTKGNLLIQQMMVKISSFCKFYEYLWPCENGARTPPGFRNAVVQMSVREAQALLPSRLICSGGFAEGSLLCAHIWNLGVPSSFTLDFLGPVIVWRYENLTLNSFYSQKVQGIWEEYREKLRTKKFFSLV